MSELGKAIRSARGYRSLRSISAAVEVPAGKKKSGWSLAYLSDVELGRRRGPGSRERLAPLAKALGVDVAELLRAVRADDGGWWVPAWPGMPWQAEMFLGDLARGVARPEAEFWVKLGRRQGYLEPEPGVDAGMVAAARPNDRALKRQAEEDAAPTLSTSSDWLAELETDWSRTVEVDVGPDPAQEDG